MKNRNFSTEDLFGLFLRIKVMWLRHNFFCKALGENSRWKWVKTILNSPTRAEIRGGSKIVTNGGHPTADVRSQLVAQCQPLNTQQFDKPASEVHRLDRNFTEVFLLADTVKIWFTSLSASTVQRVRVTLTPWLSSTDFATFYFRPRRRLVAGRRNATTRTTVGCRRIYRMAIADDVSMCGLWRTNCAE